ncbi:hypothetical protein FRC00_009857, partial [Tulasnella sp. 408]
MRFTLFYIVGLAATSMAVPDEFRPAGEALHPLIPKTGKRSISIVKGIQLREVAAIPAGGSLPEESDDGPTKRPRSLRKAQVVPDSLQDPASKRVPYCSDSGYGICPDGDYCCPI